MTPEMAFEVLKVLFLARLPGFMWGGPGTGKSDLMRQLADYFKVKIRDIRAVTIDPVDLRGIPKVEDKMAKWYPPDFLPMEPGYIVFFDELPTAPPLVQGACLQLILDGKLGGYVAPEPTWFFGAGNPEGVAAIVHRMPSPLANRFCHIDVEVSVQSWLKWVENGPQVNTKTKYVKIEFQRTAPEVASFIELRPELLYNFDPELFRKPGQKAFATPRSCEFASRLFETCKYHNIDKRVMKLAIKGCTGQGWSTEFMEFLKNYENIPMPRKILQDPENAPIPTELSQMVALARGLSDMVNEDNVEQFMVYARRLPEEFSVQLVRTAAKRADKLIHNSAGYIQWAIEYQKLTKPKRKADPADDAPDSFNFN